MDLISALQISKKSVWKLSQVLNYYVNSRRAMSLARSIDDIRALLREYEELSMKIARSGKLNRFDCLIEGATIKNMECITFALYLTDVRYAMGGAIDSAYKCKYFEIGEMLLSLPGDRKYYDVTRAMKKVAKYGDVGNMRFLLNIGIHDEEDLNTALHSACDKGNYEVAAMLIEAGADPNDYYGRESPLEAACYRGYLSIVSLLLSNGADMYIFASITCACARGHIDIVKYFIENGYDIHDTNDIALRDAHSYDQKEIVEYLLSCGADPKYIQ